MSSASTDLSSLAIGVPRRSFPGPRQLLKMTLVAVALLLAASTVIHLEVPAPTGALPVGRKKVWLVDTDRPEANTPTPTDNREVPALVWYPAATESGDTVEYVPALSQITTSLVDSGEVGRLEALGLRFVRDPALEGARVSSASDVYPVILLSPGNFTNVSFYAALAEDLASHGFVVVGLDHPFSGAAVQLSDGSVVTGEADGFSPETVAAETEGRVRDISFVIDRLDASDPALSFLDGKVDLDSIGVMGHSLGGVAAAEACNADRRVAACLNLDGQQAGGPFSTDVEGQAPSQPFMYLTKETEMHPEVVERFEAAGKDAFLAVIPAASHEQFADGSLFRPSLIPWDRTADDVIAAAREMVVRFFDHTLTGEPVEHLGKADLPTDVFLNVFPLGDRPPLPE